MNAPATGPLFAYHQGRQLLVFCDIMGKPYGGVPLAAVQAIDPKATHHGLAVALPSIRDPKEAPRIVTGVPLPASLDPAGIAARLRRR